MSWFLSFKYEDLLDCFIMCVFLSAEGKRTMLREEAGEKSMQCPNREPWRNRAYRRMLGVNELAAAAAENERRVWQLKQTTPIWDGNYTRSANPALLCSKQL